VRVSRLLTACLLILALLTPAWAHVTFDAVGPSSSGATAHNSTSLSWNHTCSGSHRLLVVGVSLSDGSDPGKTITGVTYNGVALTSSAAVHSGAGTAGYVQLWYLVAPDTGTNSVAVTLSTVGANTDLLGGSVSFDGVDQSTPVQNFNSATGSGTSASLVITSATGDMVVDAEANGSNVPVSTKTVRWSEHVSNGSRAGNAGQSTAAGAASVTMGYTTSSDSWGMAGFDIKAAGADITISGMNRLGVAVDQNGYTVLNAVKAGGAFLNSKGITINPDGAMYYATSITAGSLINVIGLRVNPDGAVVTSTTPSSAFINSFSFLTNPDGSLIISTTPSNPRLNSEGVLVNDDGAMLVAIE